MHGVRKQSKVKALAMVVLAVALAGCVALTACSSVASDEDSDRYSFKINFGKNVDGQTYHGLDKLNLNNLYADATYMKDYLSYEIFRAIGVDSPLTSYIQVKVNGEDLGLYLAIEDVDSSYLDRTRDGSSSAAAPSGDASSAASSAAASSGAAPSDGAPSAASPVDATATVNCGIDTPLSGAQEADRPMWAWISSSDEYLARYHEIYNEMLTTYFESGECQKEIERVRTMIAPYVKGETSAFYTYDEFETAVDTLEAFVDARAQSIRAQLSGTLSTKTSEQDASAQVDASGINISAMGSQGGSR